MTNVRTSPSGPVVSVGAGSSVLVASVGGTRTDGDGIPETTLYTVPEGKAGMYRFTSFVGPASTNGTGQVSVKWHWPAFAPDTGNLSFMQPGESGVGGGTNFVIGEGSEVVVDPPFTWWAEEGTDIGYEVQSSFEGGDWVWSAALEYLGPLSS